jgi:hypothetical protein
MEDFLFHQCSVQIVYAVVKGNLRQGQRHRDPVAGNVVEVIEIDSTDGQVAKLIQTGGRFDVLQLGCFRDESKRDKPGKSPGFILQLAQLPQMIDAMLNGFDVPEEHCAGAAPAHLMP